MRFAGSTARATRCGSHSSSVPAPGATSTHRAASTLPALHDCLDPPLRSTAGARRRPECCPIPCSERTWRRAGSGRGPRPCWRRAGPAPLASTANPSQHQFGARKGFAQAPYPHSERREHASPRANLDPCLPLSSSAIPNVSAHLALQLQQQRVPPSLPADGDEEQGRHAARPCAAHAASPSAPGGRSPDCRHVSASRIAPCSSSRARRRRRTCLRFQRRRDCHRSGLRVNLPARCARPAAAAARAAPQRASPAQRRSPSGWALVAVGVGVRIQ